MVSAFPLPHELAALAYDAHHRPRLNSLAPASRDPVLDLGQAVEPSNHSLGLDLHPCQLLRQGGDDVGQRKAVGHLQGVDGGEAGGDVGGREQRVGDLGDGLGGRGGYAVVDSLRRDGFPHDVLLGDPWRILRLQGCA